jgi:hypothetical protein
MEGSVSDATGSYAVETRASNNAVFTSHLRVSFRVTELPSLCGVIKWQENH